MSEPVTIDRVARGLAVLAYAMSLDGPVYAPLFEKLEREHEAMRRQQDTVEPVTVDNFIRAESDLYFGGY